MSRKDVLRIVLFAAASLALALTATSLVIDAIVESDVREEMSQTLNALRKDVQLSFDFWIGYHASLSAREIRDPTNFTEIVYRDMSDRYGFDTMRILRADGGVVRSFGSGTNAVLVTRSFPDGRHVLEVGIDPEEFAKGGVGALVMAACCDNWPRIIDGFLFCFRRDDARIIASNSPRTKAGESAFDIFADYEEIREHPSGTYFNATVFGDPCLCRAADRGDFRFVSVVPLSALAQYRRFPFTAIGLVLILLVTAFTLVALRLSSVSARLHAYIEGEKSRMREDLSAARLVQMSALPPFFPPQLSYSVQARMDPAKVVGGDFYDYQVLPDGQFYFLVADVSGKGISAAMFMMRAKSVIKQCLAETRDLAVGMTKANALLAEKNESMLFVTVWVGVLNPRTGRVYYVNAGHNPPIVRRANGGNPRLERVTGSPSLVMALMPGVEYPVHELYLSPGDTLFLYTDGVTEAQNLEGKFYGEERLENVLQASSENLVDRVRADLDAFQGEAEPADDVTMVSLDYVGTPPGAARGFPCSLEVGFVEAARFVEEELVRIGCPPNIQTKFLTAFDEIGSNVVSYSGTAYFTVKVSVEATPRAITLTVTDAGRPFNPLEKVGPDLNLPLEARVAGGFGIFITRQLMDDVIYCRDENRNVLTLRKSLGAVDAQNNV